MTRKVSNPKTAKRRPRKPQAGETRFGNIVAHSAEGILVVNQEGIVRLANLAAGALLGRRADGLVGESFGIAVTADEIAKLDIVRPGGETAIVEMRVMSTEWDGRPAHLVYLRDITERARTQEALREWETKYHTFFNSFADPIIIFDQETKYFMNCNQAAIDRYGYTLDEWRGMTPYQLHPPEDLENVERNIDDRQDTSLHTYTHITKNGERLAVETHTEALEYQGRQAWISIVRDITGRKRTENLIRIQRDLALALSAAPSLDGGLRLCLESALRVSEMESGGIYLVNETSGTLDLTSHQGLSPEFIAAVSRFETDSANARLVMAGKPIYTEHLRLGVPLDETRRREGLRAIAIIPIHHEGRVIGCLNIASHVVDQVPVFARDALETIAAQVGNSIARLKAEKALREYAERLQILHKIDQAILVAQSPEAIAQAAVQHIRRLVPCERASVALFDFEADEAILIAVHVSGETGLGAGERFPLDAYGITPDLRQGQPHIVEDILALAERPATDEQLLAEGIRSYVSVPLISQVELIGALNLGASRPAACAPEHIEIARETADQVAVAIQQAQLREKLERYAAQLEQRTAQLEAVRQIGLELAAELDLDSLLHSIVARAVELLGGAGGDLFLYQPEHDVLRERIVVSDTPSQIVLRRGEGLAGKILEIGQPIIVDDYQRWEGRAAAYAGSAMGAVVGAPIRWGDEFLGVLGVRADSPRTFSQADAALLNLFATQAALTIKNGRLFQSEREQRVLVETLRQIDTTLVSTLNVDTVLDRLLEQIGRVVPNDAANIMLIEGDHVRTARWRGYDRFDSETFLSTLAFPVASISNLRRMVDTGEPVVVPDTHADPNWVPIVETDWIRSYVGVPIRARGQVIGFLNADSATPSFFGPSHAERLRAFADQAAIALENARLFSMLNQEKEQLELLYRLGQQLSESLNVRQVAQRALDGICAVVGAQHGVVVVREPAVDGGLDSMRLVAVSGYDAEPIEALNQRLGLRIGDGLNGWVAAHRKPALVDDVRKDERWLVLPGMDDWVRSALSVPLLSGDALVGTLSVYNERIAFFNDDHRRLVESAAASVAVAIANARLYQAEREQFHRLQQSQAQLVQAEKIAALGRLVASIAHEINNPLQAVQGCLTLAVEEMSSGLRREKLARYLVMAEKEIERIASIVRRMRDFYRPAREGLQPTDVRTVLESVLELAGKQLQHSHITVERGPVAAGAGDLPMIQANPDHLKQVFLNLVLNAIDAMAERGGTLRVRMALDQMQRQRDDQSVPAVRIEFSDTGKGMPPEVLSRMFEPFFTTKSNGTGLGMSISYGIIEAHNGQITVTSQVGVGTTFAILLPAEQS